MREPDLWIGGKDAPYLLRWYLIPRNRFFNIYLHCILRDDDDRALHDHPWWSISFLLDGIIKEIDKKGSRFVHMFLQPRVRSAKYAHRLELVTDSAWTLFITGPRIREWGFHCPQGWRHWSQFTDATGEKVGKGCND